jgi:hypothetical protein
MVSILLGGLFSQQGAEVRASPKLSAETLADGSIHIIRESAGGSRHESMLPPDSYEYRALALGHYAAPSQRTAFQGADLSLYNVAPQELRTSPWSNSGAEPWFIKPNYIGGTGGGFLGSPGVQINPIDGDCCKRAAALEDLVAQQRKLIEALEECCSK